MLSGKQIRQRREEGMMSDTEQTEDLGLRWPKADDKVFVEVHPLRGAWAATATDERLYRMIKGFHESGDLLVAETELNPRRALDLLYPVIFAYRQSLELRLKYLLIAYAPFADEEPDYRSHDLAKLWEKCKHVILLLEDRVQPSEKQAFEAVDALVAEYTAIDPGSDAFRFAHNTKGQPLKLAVSTIDLVNLRSVVVGIHNFLECVDLHLHHGRGVPRCSH
jgi:hypothetical protein